MDIGLYILLFIFGKVYFCDQALRSQGVTRCDQLAVPALETIMFIFPGAFALAPLFGTITGAAEITGSALVRVYGAWSRLAVINTIAALAVYSAYKTDTTKATLGWVVGLLVGSRLVQCLVVDQYAAHIERQRWTRGWDGLTTSLAVALDLDTDLVY
jgi:Na+/glutamate symporter